MQPNRQPLDDFIHHPALSHLAPGASIPSIVEDAVQRRRRADCELSGGVDDEGDSSAAGPEWRTVGQRLAGLRATLTLPLPRIDIRQAYSALIRWTVTLVTLAWRGPARRVRLDPALGTLRNSGLFLRPHASRQRDDDAGDESGLVPAALLTTPTQKR
jgi:hypothetical protein